MWVYILLLIVVFMLLLLSIIYLMRLAHDIIKKRIDHKYLSWVLSIAPILLFIPGFFIDAVNAIVVDIHLIVIIALTHLIFWIAGKISKKTIGKYTALITGIVLTSLLLVHGYYLAHHVVETDYQIETAKDLGTDTFRIVQISDSHLGATMDGKEFTQYMNDISQLNADIVVITGDYIDDDTPYEYMVDGTYGLGQLQTKYGVYFVYGNHDKGYYHHRDYTDDDIRRELKNNHVTILEDSSVEITDNIVLVGRQDAEIRDRAKVDDLVADLSKDRYVIILDHQPNDYDNEMNKADLVLSGHTHGGQLFPLGELGVLLGANDKVYGVETRENTTFIVNSGISDWAIKFKTGTISEYTVIDIKKKSR